MVDCNGETWDLKADIVSDGQNSAYNIYINGGASGNGSALVAGPTTDDAFTSANPAKEFGIGFAYDADKAGSAFADNSWYAYDVLSEGNHYLWPNFITYVLDTDPASDTDEPFKLQVINYYDTDNTSGFVTIRFTELSNNGE